MSVELKGLFKAGSGAGHSPDALGSSKNASGSVGISLKKGAPQVSVDKPHPSKES